MAHWHIARADLGIVKSKMPLAERAAPGVLPAQPDGRAFKHKTAERERLRESPVDRSAGFKRLAPLFDEPAQFGMQMEVLGEACDPFHDALDPPEIHAGAGAEACDLFARNRAQLLQLEPLGVLLRRFECGRIAARNFLAHRR